MISIPYKMRNCKGVGGGSEAIIRFVAGGAIGHPHYEVKVVALIEINRY